MACYVMDLYLSRTDCTRLGYAFSATGDCYSVVTNYPSIYANYLFERFVLITNCLHVRFLNNGNASLISVRTK